MKLKDKAKEDFEDYFRHTKMIDRFTFLEHIKDLNIGIEFYKLPESMQWGVLVDWFDSVGIHLNINYEAHENGGCYYVDYVHAEYDILMSYQNTRQGARTKAIEKANEIYNNEQN